MRFVSSASIVTALVLVGACSLINAPDDVKPLNAGATAGTDSPTAGTESNGGKTGKPSGGNSGSGGSSTSPGGEPGMGGDGNMGNGGDIGAGGAGEVDPGPGINPTTGLLVLAAQDDKKVRYLSVLNGRTGKDIASEVLPVAAVAYDEAPLRHLWFVFTASAFPATATGAADLEVRRFNDATGKWFVVGRTTALPPPVPDQLVVLNDRLVYLSHRVVMGKAVSAMTVLDTSNPAKVSEITSRTADTGETYVGITGDRGSDVNAKALGGRLRLMISSGCTTDCDLNAQQIFVGDTLTDGTSALLDRFVGQPRFLKAQLEDRLYAAIRSTKPSNRMVIRSLQGPDLSNPTVSPIANFMGDDVGGFTLVECAAAGVITDVTGSQLFAFNLASGNTQMAALTYPGGPVYTEQFGPAVISLDSASAPGLRGFDISKSGMTNVAINARTVWAPNSTLMPLTGATRRGESFKCP